ncbi:hypothetical protein SAMN02745704_02395 [Paucidesulfovibrio gracilis DSM 16080]|uniref:Uncharacterized protein n=1 Tax=Paucidesulfovibrio gracilis DSM 16080 TaxID=1121449 RepID=A0A1T4XSP6_9BACT|nr:hypothetical protein [Paucidesulfovibrio gracilis]SKA92168.1 hypothetical protein SAMN02745704_02395 [Paucidesulfovibrio gracilis DSM 16080]
MAVLLFLSMLGALCLWRISWPQPGSESTHPRRLRLWAGVGALLQLPILILLPLGMVRGFFPGGAAKVMTLAMLLLPMFLFGWGMRLLLRRDVSGKSDSASEPPQKRGNHS